jgi:CRISPR-associated protein Csx10
MTITGTLRLDFTSDWHCGTGRGRHGGVDQTIARDVDGFPFVPAKTVRGLWRDACERAALGLDNGTPAAWSELVRHIFGSAGVVVPENAEGRLRVRPARLPAAWRSKIAESEAPELFKNSLVTTRYGVKVDADGVAADDTLRLTERARGGLGVEAEFSVASEQLEWAIQLMLSAGAALWHHAGASRRRGAGACRATVEGVPAISDLVARHGNDIATFAMTKRQAMPTRFVDAGPAEAEAKPRVAQLIINTLLPVLATRVVEGNAALGHDFIPGSVILPLVARAMGDQASAIIRDGALRVSDATAMLDGKRSFPTPKSVMSGDKGRAWRLTNEVCDGLDACGDGLKSISGWAVCGAERWHIGDLPLATTAHASIDDDSQRPLDAGLYTFQAIPAGVRLASEVRIDAPVDDVTWSRVLAVAGAQSLGRYRFGDYGQVNIEVNDLSGRDESSADGELVGGFDVWLTSDTYLINEDGIPTPTAAELAVQLSDRLGVHLQADPASLTTVVRRESWTRARSLPRETRVCLAGGSVVRLRFDGLPLSAEVVDAALAEGTGALRVEGFGQLRRLSAVPVVATRVDVDGASLGDSSDVPTPDAEAVNAYWKRYRRLAWEAEILRRVRVIAADPQVRSRYAGVSTGKAQRGTLRKAAHALTRDKGSVQRWLHATQADSGKVNEWGEVSLAAIEKIAVASDDGWAARVAEVLNGHGRGQAATDTGVSSMPEIPIDLGGARPQWVAAALLAECLSQRGRDNQERASK